MSEGRRFYLQERLGAGAFGEVYLAEQDSGAGFRRRVAIKLLNAQAERMAEVGRRFRDEARILGRLSHKHIVTVLDLVKLEDRWAVVMDYVPGADVDRVVYALEKADEHMPVPAALEVGIAVLSALDAAYHADDGNGNQLQVVHRDIKPANVLLTKDADVKVLDFGIARVQMDTREAMTKNARMGTERYMAPERILGEGDLVAGDVYATAATVAEMILREPLGRTPVLDDRHTPWLEGRLDELRTRVEGPDDAVDALVESLRTGLATEPEDRPTPAELADTWRALLRRVEGPGLAEFARQFVPRVDDILGREIEPVDGVLTENSGTSQPRSTLLPNATYTEPQTQGPAATTTEAPPRSRTPIVIGAVAAIVLLLGVGVVAAAGIGLALSAGGDDTELASNDPVVETPPPMPPPDTIAEEMPGEDTDAPEPPPDEPPDAGTAADNPPPTLPKPRPQPVTKVEEPVAPTFDPDAPRIDSAKVVLADASSLQVTCGDVSATGTASVFLRRFPAGTCSVRGSYLGRELRGTVDIQRKMQVTCTPEGDSLSCR